MPDSRFPVDVHHAREKLINEFFARPAQSCAAKTVVTRLVMHTDDSSAARDREHLSALCRQAGALAAQDDARHHVVRLSGGLLIWERHTEFSTYTVFAPQKGTSGLDYNPLEILPNDWIKQTPGTLLCATRLWVVAGKPDDTSDSQAKDVFGDAEFSASTMRDGKAYVAADFRLHGDGFTRFYVIDNSGDDTVRGRLVQRLLELDMYRIAALLALPIAQDAQPKLTQHEATLADILEDMSDTPDMGRDREVLQKLSQTAADIEAIGAQTAYRFAAAQAYYRIVLERIERLREDRAEGRERLGIFVNRRLAPAMRTCAAVSDRQATISTRIDRVTQLLATRVEVSVQEQNADLLQSMNRNAKAQVRLQETVEGFSAIAMTYYGVGLVLYIAKGLKEAGIHFFMNPPIIGAIAAPLLFFVSISAVRRLRRKALNADRDTAQ
ncbi:MAG: DUF3422 domain-containing protein [Pseudomonadota bacterium]